MRAVALNAKPGKELERVLGNRMALAVEDVDAVFGRHDAEIRVAHLRRESVDILDRCCERLAVVDLQKARMIAPRQRSVVARGKHDAAGEIVLLDCPHRMRADMDGEHVADVEVPSRGRPEPP